jgi:K+-transporting ATPase ATPase B chain
VALAMNSGTGPAKEAANLIDLDNNPTKILEAVRISKQNLITIGGLATFTSANDIAKVFALFPALLAGTFPALKPLDLIGFSSPSEALMSFLIFNAVIILLLLPLAVGGSPFRPGAAPLLLRKNLLLYGITGALTPFVILKLLSLVL